MQRWLITGASGQLGGYVLRALSDRHSGDYVHALGRAPMPGAHVIEWIDLRDGAALTELLRRVAPTRILHLAAISPVVAESDPASSHALHVDAAMQMAAYAASTGGWMLYASSDFVWDGNCELHKEGDVPLPANVYGRTKLAGERVVAEHGCGLIARYSLLFGLPVDERQTSWTAIAARLERNEPVIAIDDEWRSPINLEDAASVTIELATQCHRGLVHISGSSAMTPYEIITMMRRELNSESEVQRVSRASFSPNVIRPSNVTQSNSLLRRLLPEFEPAPLRSGLRIERTSPPRFSVIIPVYHGADTLGRSLNALADQRFGHGSGLQVSDVEVLLALNDGQKDSEVVAKAHVASLRARNFQVRLLRTPQTRRAAITAAEEVAAMGTHRLYLDQDARLSPHALSAMFAALAPGTGIHFAAPRGLFDPSPSLVVRAFCRYWCSLPYCAASPVTMGAYAVSAEGRRRWGKLPHLASDDKFVRLLFAPEERRLLESESYHVVAPRSWGELIQARRRYLRGNRELARATHLAPVDPIPRYRGVLRPLLRPSTWFDFAVFVAACGAAWLTETVTARTRDHRELHA
ncbi:sugar nucleotide-binding protein [Bradyrhizobium sp. WSM 1738]|uniref:sugar nucleotide-binding protein n=1 Tax=Bradyrhizobium hereditatis TaxID=2821405 RepID=UPI001CE383E3|nr:sugar nucleotide-binding protein [Bradyrhizobium hereditatis]MCA6119990.1 sugar nucleotide-binding protein [Bradyrhizobium hereditatis]